MCVPHCTTVWDWTGVRVIDIAAVNTHSVVTIVQILEKKV